MSVIHLIEGPVGAGKSTYAAKLALQLAAVHIDLDQWMVTLFRPDRPQDGFMDWYADRKNRCLEQIWLVSLAIVESGSDVVLELGLVQRDDRLKFYSQVEGMGYELAIYVLDTPLEVRRARVRERNNSAGGTFKMEVSDEIFAIANAAWQPPDEQEFGRYSIETIEN